VFAVKDLFGGSYPYSNPYYSYAPP
jgi:hypothetical protein